MLRLDQANADPVYGGPATAYDKRSASDPELEALFRDVKTIELWFVVIVAWTAQPGSRLVEQAPRVASFFINGVSGGGG